MKRGNHTEMFTSQLLLFGIIVVITPIITSTEVNTTESNKCPQMTVCPFRASSCYEDEDCNPDSNCCESPCGKICIKQLRTGCETLQNAASRRAKALGTDIRHIRTPRCNQNGGFEQIQCDNEIVSSCWCADEQGFEIAGTRAPAAALVNCTSPKPCAGHTCRMLCPHGFALEDNGCPLCKCRDPCENIKCPNSLDCHLEELACSDPPCPPIPTCKRGRSLDNICPVGDPLRISDTVRPFLCGNEPSKPSCPPMYQCLVQQGNDYGVCCPASLKIQKSGSCPITTEEQYDCGSLCTHDLECPSIQKCCDTNQCGLSCVHPKNVTECFHQKTLSELLVVNERIGRGYVPQCTDDGEFTPKQCSRNGLVCWCVDRMGVKIKGTMSAAENVNCSIVDARTYSAGRSIDKLLTCQKLDCAAVCEYGFKLDESACPTCKCDDPCDGYVCPEDEECVVVRESTCSDFLCPTLPVCRPKVVYVNPCKQGTPMTDDLSGVPISCDLRTADGNNCPEKYECKAVPGLAQSVCCPNLDEVDKINTDDDEMEPEASENDEKIQSMCEYLKDFSDNMEGTREGMSLGIPSPSCDSNGNYLPWQCYGDKCSCVDDYGTEIPKSRGRVNSSHECEQLRKSLDCLDLTCRMGCDYGFVLENETSCPTCLCRDPCETVTCSEDHQCQMVEVSCKDHYCPPVPACLPKKIGQCPYLVPAVSTSCDFECNSNLVCNGTQICCSNGCGTQCTDPLLLTACQHQQSVAQYHAHESGIPANRVFIPQCTEDGNYETLQCNPAQKKCWCVDFRGFEISQTRTSSKSSTLDCSTKSYTGNCPLYNCDNDCEHGFDLDDHGCRTCNCIDPCESIKCSEEGESCRLVNVECIGLPCPSVPMCLPKKENPCHTGEPLKIGDDVSTCGPEYENCPSSHKCQLSPLGEYAVCCPKPRDVCFEAVNDGYCSDLDLIRNLTRFYFNSKTNKCETFTYAGCQGNHNNFHTEEMCKAVCPVLSQCERLREKNLRTSQRYKKPTFIPQCDPVNGNWKPVQCMEHVGVCWCVNPQGQTQKGTIVRGKEPDCNFRQARGRSTPRTQLSDVDLILEELMMHIASISYNEDAGFETEPNTIASLELPVKTRCEALKAQCDSQGKFIPAQCDQNQCWCVDEAGNQLPQTSSFKKGEQLCLPTPIEYVDVAIGLRGEYDDVTAVPVIKNIKKIVNQFKGTIRDDELIAESTSEALFIKFSLIGSNKVDVAYILEQMVKQQKFPSLMADITKSRFTHQLGPEPSNAERIIALEHREIVSQSPVSMIAPYHTALIVIAAASAFVICTLTVLVILYRRKTINVNQSAKILDGPQRFLNANAPIYIELPNEKMTPPMARPDDKIIPQT